MFDFLTVSSEFKRISRQERDKNDIIIIGGGALSNNWCQIIADICYRNILRYTNSQEATSFGAAITGGVGVGIFNDFNIVNNLLEVNNTFYPRPEKLERYEKLYSIFLEVNQTANDLFKKIAAINN